MKNLQTKIRAVEEEHAEEVVNKHLERHEISARDRAIFILGGIRITDRLAKALDSQAMVAAFKFQKDDLHATLGYPAFADFLDNSEFSPMSKHEFYERKKVFEKEGEKLFDALNEIEVPLKTRKLLGKGNIQLDGEMVIITDKETGEEFSIEVTDKNRLLETITALADANADKSSKLSKQKESLQKAEETIDELHDEVERIKVAKIIASENSHSSALMNLVAAFGALTLEAEKLTAIEKEQFALRTFETIASLMSHLSDGYDRKDWTKEISKKGKSKVRETVEKDDDDLLIESVLEDTEDDNDQELAGMM